MSGESGERSLSWAEFERVDIRVGTIIEVSRNQKARKPAYVMCVDLGPDLGVKTSSAQVTALYEPDDLVGCQVLCVVNFPPKRIADVVSEVLVTGFADGGGGTIVASVERPVPNGARLL